jgi:hypothetical protein
MIAATGMRAILAKYLAPPIFLVIAVGCWVAGVLSDHLSLFQYNCLRLVAGFAGWSAILSFPAFSGKPEPRVIGGRLFSSVLVLLLIVTSWPSVIPQRNASAVNALGTAAQIGTPRVDAALPATHQPPAERPPTAEKAGSAIDRTGTVLLIVGSSLGLLATLPGLALFDAGMVRRKNLLATMMQPFVICCLVTVIWVVAGYSLAFTEGNAYLGDFSQVMLSGISQGILSGTNATVTLGAGNE